MLELYIPYIDHSDGQIYGLHHTQMAQMVKYMVCIIHRWLRWSNIWFASSTDGSDGQIYGLHHQQMAQMVKYMRTIIESLFENFLFFVTPSPKDQRSGALLVGAWPRAWRRHAGS